jgi:hypothetical protein
MSTDTGVVVCVGQEAQARQVFVGPEARKTCQFLGQLRQDDNLPEVNVKAFQHILEFFEHGFEKRHMLEDPVNWQKVAVRTWWLAGQLDLPTLQDDIVDFVQGVYTQCYKDGQYNRVEAGSFEILPRIATNKQIENLFVAFHAGLLLNAKVSGEKLDQELQRLRQDVADEIRSAMFNLEAGLNVDLIQNQVQLYWVDVPEKFGEEEGWTFRRLDYPEIVVIHASEPADEGPAAPIPPPVQENFRFPTALPTPPASRKPSVSAAVSQLTVEESPTLSAQPKEDRKLMRTDTIHAPIPARPVKSSVLNLPYSVPERASTVGSKSSLKRGESDAPSNEAEDAATTPSSISITSSAAPVAPSTPDPPAQPTPAASVLQPALQANQPAFPTNWIQNISVTNVHLHNVQPDGSAHAQSGWNERAQVKPTGLQQQVPAPSPALHVPGISSQDPAKNVSIDLDMFTNMMNSLRVGASIPPADLGLSGNIYQPTPSVQQWHPPPADSGYSSKSSPVRGLSQASQPWSSPFPQNNSIHAATEPLPSMHGFQQHVAQPVARSSSEPLPPPSMAERSTGTVGVQAPGPSLRPRRVQQIIAQSAAKRPRRPIPVRIPQELPTRKPSWTGTTLSKYPQEALELEQPDHYPLALTHDNLSAHGIAPVAPGNTINAHEVVEASESASTTPVGNWADDVARAKRFEYDFWSWKKDGVIHYAKKVKNGFLKAADEQVAEYASAHTPDPTRTFSKIEGFRGSYHLPDTRAYPREESLALKAAGLKGGLKNRVKKLKKKTKEHFNLDEDYYRG